MRYSWTWRIRQTAGQLLTGNRISANADKQETLIAEWGLLDSNTLVKACTQPRVLKNGSFYGHQSCSLLEIIQRRAIHFKHKSKLRVRNAWCIEWGTILQSPQGRTCNNLVTQSSSTHDSTPGRWLMSNLTWGSASLLDTTPAAISEDGSIWNLKTLGQSKKHHIHNT